MPFSWHPDESPPPIEEHSKAKLTVLRSYLHAYFDRLNLDCGDVEGWGASRARAVAPDKQAVGEEGREPSPDAIIPATARLVQAFQDEQEPAWSIFNGTADLAVEIVILSTDEDDGEIEICSGNFARAPVED